MDNVPVFFFLGIDDVFWFWPSFVSSLDDIDYMSMDVPRGFSEVPVISELNWPDTGNLAMSNLSFWGAMLNEELSEILGEYAEVNWSFGP